MSKTFQARFKGYMGKDYLYFETPIKKEFEINGEKFAVHRKLSKPYNEVIISKDTWDVSHIETGFSLIGTYPKTVKQAIQDAYDITAKCGFDKLKIALDEARNRSNIPIIQKEI